MTVAGSDLRATLRARRRAISPSDQTVAAAALVRLTAAFVAATTPGIVAAYVATDGEISPAPLIARLRELGWEVAYPRIADDAMVFHLVTDEADLVEGRWQLLEPEPSTPLIEAFDLDMVLAPLVGFDARCERIGRGKAFYDRAFAFLQDQVRPGSPILLGLAHDLQLVDPLQQSSHDVTLDAVATPSRFFGNFLAPM